MYPAAGHPNKSILQSMEQYIYTTTRHTSYSKPLQIFIILLIQKQIIPTYHNFERLHAMQDKYTMKNQHIILCLILN